MRAKDPEIISKIDQHIEEDIQSCKKIIKLIDIVIDVTKTKQEIREGLENIALSSQQIHRNGKREGKERYLRNKYSTNDYVKDKIRPWGINFDLLSEIKFIPDEIFMPEYSVILSDIREVLVAVKQKLELAIQVEERQIDYNVAMKNFVDLSQIYLKEKTLKKAISINAGKRYFEHILTILDNLSRETLDLKSREDRYFLGINLAILGETSKKIEIISDLDKGVLRTFKLIRNRTAHNVGLLVRNISNEQEDIYKFILDKLVRDLRFVAKTAIARFEAAKSVDQLIDLDISYGAYTPKQRSILKKTLEILIGERSIDIAKVDFSQFDSPISVLILEQNEADKQIRSARDKTGVTGTAPVADDSTTKKIAQNIASLVPKENETLDSKLKSLKKLFNTEKRSRTEEKVKFSESDRQQGKDFAKIINESVKKSGDMNFPFFQDNPFPTEQEIENITAYLKKNPKLRDIQLIEPISDVDEENEQEQEQTSISQKEKKINTLQSKLVKKYEFIAAEVDYIFEVIQNTSLSDYKKESIIKFAVAKIGQTYRDIEESCLDEPVSELQSKMHKKSTRISAETRSQIMHKVFDQDFNSSLASNLFRHILPLQKDIKALSRIIQNQTNDTNILFTEKRFSQMLLIAMSYTDLMQYEKAIDLYKEILLFIGIGKKDESIDSIILEYKRQFKRVEKQISPDKLDISNNVFNCFYLIAINYGLIGNRQKLNNEQPEIYKAAYITKILILDILLELKKDIHDRQKVSILGNKAVAFANIDNHEEAFKLRLEAYLLLNKISDVSEQDKSFYLASLAIAAYNHYCFGLENIELTNKHQIEKMMYHIILAKSLLWWAKELMDKANSVKNSESYLQILLPLTKYTMLLNQENFARELFAECKDLLSKTSMKEDNYLITSFEELKSLIPNEVGVQTTDKDKAILTLRSLVAIDVFFCDQQVEFDVNEFIQSSKDKIDRYSLSTEDKVFVSKLFTNHQAVYLFRKKQYQDSIRLLLTLITDGNAEGVTYESLGDAYHAIGKYNIAINNFQKAFEMYATTYVGERAFALPKKIIKSLSKTSFEESKKKEIIGNIENSYLQLKEKVKDSDDKDKLFYIEFFLLSQYHELRDSSKVRSLAPVCRESLKRVDTTIEERAQGEMIINQIYNSSMPYSHSVVEGRKAGISTLHGRN